MNMNANNKDIMLSVRLVTYNQENFISSALEGALMQRTNFPFEIVVGDDCSTDGTPAIIESYRSKNERLIRVLPNESNLGAKHNAIRTLRACTGKYIAHLDGDDYWTDPYKLQQQVEILEANPGIACCFHNMEVRYEDPTVPSKLYCSNLGKQVLTRYDLAKNNFIPSSGNVFRKGLVPQHPDWFYLLPFGDWALHLLNAQHGDIYYLPKVMGVYRKHASGLWTSNTPEKETEIRLKFLDIVIENYRDDPALLKILKQSRKKYSKFPGRQGKRKSSLKNRIIDILIRYLKKLK